VTQLHSSGYRNPGELPARDVLVVGAANSGAQIAEDLAATHRVHLSRGARIPRLPRRLLGKSVHFYGDHLGLITAPLDSWRGRTQRGDLLIGPSLRQLSRRHGVDLRGRTTAAREHTVSFETEPNSTSKRSSGPQASAPTTPGSTPPSWTRKARRSTAAASPALRACSSSAWSSSTPVAPR
jgi:cation diffusion facilitator CzcD-associated flavoprotein CzcO